MNLKMSKKKIIISIIFLLFIILLNHTKSYAEWITSEDMYNGSYLCNQINGRMHYGEDAGEYVAYGPYTANAAQQYILTYGTNERQSWENFMTFHFCAPAKQWAWWIYTGQCSDATLDLPEHCEGLGTEYVSLAKRAEARQILANAYAATSTTTTVSVSSNTGNSIKTSNRVAGPFNFTFSGTISSIDVKDKNGSTISGITYQNASHTAITMSQIKSGEDFYIVNPSPSSKVLSSLRINVGATSKVTNYWLCVNASLQNMVRWSTTYQTTTAHADITILALGNLKIEKKDYDDSGVAINTAKFAVFREGSGWLGYNSTDQAVTYGNDWGNSVGKFQTGKSYCGNTKADSKLTLSNLEEGEYHIFEVHISTSEGGEYKYTLSDQDGYTTTYSGNLFNSNAKWKITGGHVYIGSVDVVAGETKSITAKNKRDANFKIIKTDNLDENVKLNGAKFVIYKIDGDDKGWLDYKSTSEKVTYGHKWSDSIGKFRTGNSYCGIAAVDGEVNLRLKIGEYYIYEIEPPSGYELSLQQRYYSTYPTETGEIKDKEYQIGKDIPFVSLGSRQAVPSGAALEVTATNRKGKIIITKKDQDTGNNIGNVRFAIFREGEGWLGYDSNSKKVTYGKTWANIKNQDYFKTPSSSTEGGYCGITPTKGKIELTGIKSGTYYIFEIETGSSKYILSGQENYHSEYPSSGTLFNDNNNWKIDREYVDCGAVTIETDNVEKKVNMTNEKAINISGYVWADQWKGKPTAKIRNGIYDSDEGIKNVLVYLKTKDGTTIKNTTTESTGEYIFTEVNKKEVEEGKYYIEFDYSGTTYKEYVSIKFNEETDKGNTSKALHYGSYPTKDEKLKEKEFGGTATTYKNKPNNGESTYGLSHFLASNLYKQETRTLTGINLGIESLENPNFAVIQDVAYVKIKFDDQKYKYVYMAEEIENTNYPTVFKEIEGGYTRKIYPSQVEANIISMREDNKEKLMVYVVYGITIQNTCKFESEKQNYDEEKLIINSLTDSIDSKYQLDTSYVDEKFDTKEIQKQIGNWEEVKIEGKTNARYKIEEKKKNAFEEGIGSKQSKTTYIQFKVKGEAINTILENPKEIHMEEIATANAYHKYKRNDYVWIGGGIEEEKEHETPPSKEEYSARGITFQLPDDTDEPEPDHEISGVVFKDNNERENNNEVVGNGRYENTETKLNKVTVELYQIDKNGKPEKEVAKIYPPKQVGDKVTFEETAASTKTNEDGEYSFKGVLPGEYVVRFTYGNDTYKAKEFKSTIVSLDSAKSAFEKSNNKEWYKYKDKDYKTEIDEYNYSVAIDDLEKRKQINENEDQEWTMPAQTPITDITIENTIKNEAKAIEVNNDTKKITNLDVTKGEFKGFNFGIIKNPRPTASPEKVITNVKLTNADLNVMFDGNPQTDTMTGVTDLDNDDKNKGSTYTRAELPAETIYGSTIEVEYQIGVENLSKDNYVEIDSEHYGWYYKYGLFDENDYSRKVQLSIDEIKDYLDTTVGYLSSEKLEGASGNCIIEVAAKEKNDIEIPEFKYKEVLKIEKSAVLKAKESKKIVSLVTQRQLASEDDDLEIRNFVEITELNNEVNYTAEREKEWGEKSKLLIRKPVAPEPLLTELTITPPTGEDRESIMIYAIAGIISLIVLATGVIIIKKKVL